MVRYDGEVPRVRIVELQGTPKFACCPNGGAGRIVKRAVVTVARHVSRRTPAALFEEVDGGHLRHER